MGLRAGSLVGRARETPHLVILFIGYLSLNAGLAFLIGTSPLLGIIGTMMINLVILLFLVPSWAIPFYILVAAPSIVIPLGTGILSRFFVGNLVLALLVVVGFAHTITTRRKAAQPLLPASLLLPLIAVALVGLSSIIYARTHPDPGVVYSFPHASVPLTLVNITEMLLLLGLPAVLVSIPGLIQTIRGVKWIIWAFVGLGMLYAFGTIFAGPLGLYSDEVILGNRRPQVFGATSSILGMLLVFFACIGLSQALYARARAASLCWWLFTITSSIAVIMSFGRQSWIALVLSGLVIIGLRTRNLLVLLLVPGFLLLLLIPGVSEFFNPQEVYGIDRLIMWQDALAIWQRHLYFGVGAGNYQFFDIAYGIDVGGVAHNQFLEVLAEMGIQGLLCLLWSLAATGRFALQRFNAATTALGKAIALAYLGYYTAYVFGGFFGDFFLPSVAGAGGTMALAWVSYHWLLLGLVLTIPRWEQPAPARAAVEPGQPAKEQLQSAAGTTSRGYWELGRSEQLVGIEDEPVAGPPWIASKSAPGLSERK